MRQNRGEQDAQIRVGWFCGNHDTMGRTSSTDFCRLWLGRYGVGWNVFTALVLLMLIPAPRIIATVTDRPITFFLLSFNNILAYAFFMVSRRNFSFETLASVTVTKRQMSAYERLGLDIREFDRLRARFEAIEREVETIREEYQ